MNKIIIVINRPTLYKKSSLLAVLQSQPVLLFIRMLGAFMAQMMAHLHNIQIIMQYEMLVNRKIYYTSSFLWLWLMYCTVHL